MRITTLSASSFAVGILSLVLLGCGGDLAVIKKDFTTLEGDRANPGNRHIWIQITFNKAVDRSTVVPATSLILHGAKDNNAAFQLNWNSDSQFTLESDKPWTEVTGTTDSTVRLTLKDTIRAMDGRPMEECKQGKPGTEKAGTCELEFHIPT
ncbi:MAG: hypothetical protein ACRD4U_08850 [Candidatus Acidiferrales bacterium]